MGQGSSSETLKFRWSGDGRWHRTNLSVLASEETASFSPVKLDGGSKGRDELMRLDNGVEIQGTVGVGQDGLDVATLEPVQIGFAYQQDGLVQPHRVNPDNELLGFQNAYWLPLPTA